MVLETHINKQKKNALNKNKLHIVKILTEKKNNREF